METLAVKGQIIGGPQNANVNSTTRLRLFIEGKLKDLERRTDFFTRSQDMRVFNAERYAYFNVLQFLEGDCARRIDEQDALRSA